MFKKNDIPGSNFDGEEVGYRKPPKRTRFQPGQSGNPAGRPKGSLNGATVLDRELNSKVVITENGRRRKITKLALMMKQLVNKGSAGDLRALKLMFELMRTQGGIPVGKPLVIEDANTGAVRMQDLEPYLSECSLEDAQAMMRTRDLVDAAEERYRADLEEKSKKKSN